MYVRFSQQSFFTNSSRQRHRLVEDTEVRNPEEEEQPEDRVLQVQAEPAEEQDTNIRI